MPQEHRFEFRPRLYGHLMAMNAVVTSGDGADDAGGTPGYEVAVGGPPDSDPMGLFARLSAKRRDLDRRHLEETEHGLAICDGHAVRGWITSDEDPESRQLLLVIDGRKVSWRELGRMVASYEGSRFKLEMRDMIED